MELNKYNCQSEACFAFSQNLHSSQIELLFTFPLKLHLSQILSHSPGCHEKGKLYFNIYTDLTLIEFLYTSAKVYKDSRSRLACCIVLFHGDSQ
ncbi:hypothetical protein XENTR_v10015079 [Xenopus tropicalis]|nr:hypothetical protein XENTR_v10015079 [Xenopus tropicalis]